MCDIGPGDKVECIQANPLALVKVGSIYTVQRIRPDGYDCGQENCQLAAIFLVEITSPHAYCLGQFRPIRRISESFREKLLEPVDLFPLEVVS